MNLFILLLEERFDATKIFVLMLLIVVILTSVGCSKSEEDVVAKVDDEIITRNNWTKG